MSLRTRLAIVTSVLVIVGVAVTGAASWFSTRAELVDEVDDFLRSRSEQVVDAIVVDRGNDSSVPTPLPEESNVVFQRLDRDGKIVATSGRSGESIPVDDDARRIAAEGGVSKVDRVEVDGREARAITRSLPGRGPDRGAVQVARLMDETNRALAGLLQRIVVIGLVLTAMAAVAGWLVARSATRPLRRLTATTQQVSETQDLSTPIDVERSDEVGSLASSFESMLGALRRSREQQQQLIQDAAHEVRTPLTTLRANLELLERAPDIGEPHRSELLRSLRSEFEALTTLFNEVVELATDGRNEAPLESLDLDDPAERAARIFTSRNGRELTTTWQGARVVGNVELLERAIGNLLANADKYSPAGLPVHLDVRGGRVAVRDHGPGIAPGDRERVFDRFYRSDEARALPGSGLGLAIVKQVVDHHGGHVFVDDAPDGGAIVGFELPVVRS